MKVTITEDDLVKALHGASNAKEVVRAARIAALERMALEAGDRRGGAEWAYRWTLSEGNPVSIQDASEHLSARERECEAIDAALQSEREGRA